MITVTMAQIESYNPCDDGWARLIDSRPKSDTPDTPFPMSDVLDSNGLDDTLWLTQHVDGPWMEFAWQCASRVAYLNDDLRVANCLSVVRRYIDGDATDDELSEVRAAAGGAARLAAQAAASRLAAGAAGAAARAAAGTASQEPATRLAAGAAARLAARAAASQSVAGQAARAAARAAAEKAEGISQEEMLRKLLDK